MSRLTRRDTAGLTFIALIIGGAAAIIATTPDPTHPPATTVTTTITVTLTTTNDDDEREQENKNVNTKTITTTTDRTTR